MNWYNLPPSVHTNNMENSKITTKQQNRKKGNAMQKIGKSIKDTFIEMSSSLAGWIDDTGARFSGKKQQPNKSVSGAKMVAKTPKNGS